METENKNKDQTATLLAILALLVAIAVVVFVIVPQLSSLRATSNQVLAKESELTAGQEKVATIKKSAQLIAAAKKDIELLGVALPAQEKTDEAVAQAASAATDAGLTVKSISVGESKNGEVAFSITTSGNYAQIDKYLQNLKSNMRPVAVNDYNISADSNGSLSASFSLAFPYVAKVEATATATASASAETTGGTTNE